MRVLFACSCAGRDCLLVCLVGDRLGSMWIGVRQATLPKCKSHIMGPPGVQARLLTWKAYLSLRPRQAEGTKYGVDRVTKAN